MEARDHTKFLEGFEKWRDEADNEIRKAQAFGLALSIARGDTLDDQDYPVMLEGIASAMARLVSDAFDGMGFAETMAKMLKEGDDQKAGTTAGEEG